MTSTCFPPSISFFLLSQLRYHTYSHSLSEHTLTYLSSLILSVFSLSLSLKQNARGDLVMRERKCDLAGTRKNSKAMSVSKSHVRTHRTLGVNLQTRKLWWEEGNKFVRVRICTRTLKTIQKNGLDATAKKFSVNLNKFAISSGTAKPVA